VEVEPLPNDFADLHCQLHLKAPIGTKGQVLKLPTRAGRTAAAKALIEILADRFPNCFFVYQTRRKPLKRGIRGDVWAALNGTISYTVLKAALGVYVDAGRGRLLQTEECSPAKHRR
jgi:hypothetical protein